MKVYNSSMLDSKLTQANINIKKLNELLRSFKRTFHLIPVIGVEIEFYLQDFTDIVSLENALGISIVEEKGTHQYEIDIGPSSRIEDIIEEHHSLKKQIYQHVHKKGGKAIFTAKPFINDYGNGMHIHVNFLRDTGKNFFDKEENLMHAMRAICHFTPDHVKLFLFNHEHFTRIKSQLMNPTNISMGKNNRTTMLRIPPTFPKRIEHRLAAPDTSLVGPIYAILDSVYKGLEEPTDVSMFEIIYGNGFDKQYRGKALIQ